MLGELCLQEFILRSFFKGVC